MAKQKERSRAAAVSATDDWQIIRQDDEEEFVGYDLLLHRSALPNTEK